MATNRRLIVAPDPAALAETAAQRMVTRIAGSDGPVAVCLTGGSSPEKLYSLLGTDAWRNKIPWQRVHWFIGDERFVGADDPLNNMGMARRAFLDRCAPASHVHAIPTEAPNPDEAARLYQSELKSFYGADKLDPARPLFEMVLMGVGPDGHTASLFPGYPAVVETERWAIGVPEAHVAPFVPRVTLTLPALGCCREMLFEVAGPEKRPILTRVLAGENLPASQAHSAGGDTVWLVDRAALPENYGA
jgi:6-phosphogluconolactonase